MPFRHGRVNLALVREKSEFYSTKILGFSILIGEFDKNKLLQTYDVKNTPLGREKKERECVMYVQR